MLLTDYFRSDRDLSWDYALQCGVRHGVIRLPEDGGFDYGDASHWRSVYDRFTAFGIKPVIIEPMPNELHDHIKAGDDKRDYAIEQVIKMLPVMGSLGIETICFNWMAHIGWLRTSSNIRERGGALVTGFDIDDFNKGGFAPPGVSITADALWANYRYFIDAVLPEAEKYGVKLALHPDDPPLPKLGDVARIMVSYENIKKAVTYRESPCLGVTMCQACYAMMGEDLTKVIPDIAEKIFFVHFRNAVGDKTGFHESFHDNGVIRMAGIMQLYHDCGVSVPIRVDHVPLMAGEEQGVAGYTNIGRLYAIGYLKGIIESVYGIRD